MTQSRLGSGGGALLELDHATLSRFDLNLLVAFDALMTERNVTRAAAVMGIKQSAMSHNLGRLRRLLRDELLVRSSEGMLPTPRALELIEPLRAGLSHIQRNLVVDRHFSPRSSTRRFRVGLPDSLEAAIMPPLLALFSQEAPGCAVQVRSTDRIDVLRELDAGRLDLAVGVWKNGTSHHKRRQLYVENYRVVLDRQQVEGRLGRPLGKTISLDDYVRLDHVLGSHREDPWGVVDEALKTLGRSRRILMSTPHFIAIPFVLKSTPAIATLPSRFAHSLAQMLELEIMPPPLKLVGFSVSMLWHSSAHRDPAHVWFREQLARLAASSTRRNKTSSSPKP
jgi:DNA-binding transcriptional LysR family regulator